MRITFDTRDYEMAHGRRPRGRGNWAFCPAEHYSAYAPPDFSLDQTFWAGPNLTYTEARREAARHFRALPDHSGDICVCS